MSSTVRTLRLLAIVGALFATPAMMVLGYSMFGSLSAAHFRIHDVAADYFEGVVTALVLLMLIQFWPIPVAHRRILTLLWVIRIGVTLGMMLAFEAIYRGDMPGYYLAGKALNRPLEAFEFGNGTGNLVAITGLLATITDAYSAMKVIFAYVGLIATYIFYRVAVISLGGERIALLYALGLLPSLLFWGSLLGKDPIVLLGIAIYCYGVAGLIVRQKMSMLVWIAVGLLIACSIRIWLGVIFVAPVIFTYAMASRTSPLAKLAFLIVAAPAFIFAMELFAEKFRIASAEELVSTTDVLATAWSQGGSAQSLQAGFDSLGSMIAFMPIGAFTALFRPLPLEIPNAFGLLAGIENAYLLSLVLIGLMRRGVGWLGTPVLLWAATTLIVWGAVYGFVSYQNLGTAFRFRVQVVPILLLLGLYLAYSHHLRPAASRRSRFGPPAQPEASAAADARG